MTSLALFRSPSSRAALGVASALIVVELLLPWHVSPRPAPRRPQPEVTLSPVAKTYGQPATGAFQAHPLFIASRMPWVAPPSQVPPKASATNTAPAPSLPVPDNYLLVGTTLSPSAQVALVRGPDARTIRLVPGASLDGWSVREIRGEEIDLEADGRAYKMTFVKHTNRSGSNDPLTSAPNRQVGLQLLPTQVRFR